MKKYPEIQSSKGFSLIELLIVVGIIGVLTSFAFGYFGDNVIAANRTEGRTALNETAGSLEKCRSLYGTYNAANCTVTFPITSESGLYTITSVLAATSFTLTATPVSGLAQSNDTDCTSLTLDNTGVQGGTGADATECW